MGRKHSEPYKGGRGIFLIAIGVLLLSTITITHGQETASTSEASKATTTTSPPTTGPGNSTSSSLAPESTRSPTTPSEETTPQPSTTTGTTSSTTSTVPSSPASTSGATSAPSTVPATNPGTGPATESDRATTTGAGTVTTTETGKDGNETASASGTSTVSVPTLGSESRTSTPSHSTSTSSASLSAASAHPSTSKDPLTSLLSSDMTSSLTTTPSGSTPEIRIASSSAVRIQSLSSNNVTGGVSTTTEPTTTVQPTTTQDSTTEASTRASTRTRTTTIPATTTLDSRLTTARSSTAWRTSAYPGTTTPTTPISSTSSSVSPTSRPTSTSRRATPRSRHGSTGSTHEDDGSSATTFEIISSGASSPSSRFQSSSVPEVSPNVIVARNNDSDRNESSRTTSTTTTSTTSQPTTTTTTTQPTSTPVRTTSTSSTTPNSITTPTTTPMPSTSYFPRVETTTRRPHQAWQDLVTTPSGRINRGNSSHDDDVRRRTSTSSTTTTVKTTTEADHEEVGRNSTSDTPSRRNGTTAGMAGSSKETTPLDRIRAGGNQRHENGSSVSQFSPNVNYSIVDEPTSPDAIRAEYPISRSMEDLQARHLRRFAITFVLDGTNMSVARWFRSIDAKFRMTLAQVLKGGDITQPFDNDNHHRFDKIDLAENSSGHGTGAVDDGLVNSFNSSSTSTPITKGSSAKKTRQSEPMMAAVSSRGDISQDLHPSDVTYLDPTPMRAGKRFYVSILVRNGKNSPDQFITARLAMEILQANTTPGILERRLETKLEDLVSGVPKEVSTISVDGVARTVFESILPMLFAIICSIAILLLIVLVTYCVSNAKKRKAKKEHWKHYQLGDGSRRDSNKQESNNRYPMDNAMELNCSRFMSSTGGGVHLANDEDCTRGEEDESRSGNESVQTNQAATLSIDSAADGRQQPRDFSSPPLPPHVTVSSNMPSTNTNRNSSSNNNNNNSSSFGTTTPIRVASTAPTAAPGITRPSTSNMHGGHRPAPTSMIAPSTANTLNVASNNRRPPAHSVAAVPASNPQNYKDWPTPLMVQHPSTSTFAVDNDGRYGSVGTFSTGGRTFAKENNTRL